MTNISSITISSSISTSSFLPPLSCSSVATIKKDLCTALIHPEIADKHPLHVCKELRNNVIKRIQEITKDISLENKIEKLKAKILLMRTSQSGSTEEIRNLKTHLAHFRKERSINQVDYSFEDNLFIKKGIQLLNQQNLLFQFDPHFERSHLWDTILLRQVVHFAFEHCSNSALIPLINKYDHGSPFGLLATTRLNSAFPLLLLSLKSSKPMLGLVTEKEKYGLLRICQHQFNLLSYIYEYIKITNCSQTNFELSKQKTEQMIETIQSDIEALQTNSSRVVLLDNGDTSFTIPGGWITHYISFEFRRTPKGEYLLILHNRGGKSNDERFHGNLTLVSGTKNYRKTRVPIKVSKDILMDKTFLLFLIQTTTKPNAGEVLYDKLYDHLITKGKGEIIQSEQEKLVMPLIELLDYPSLDLFTPQREKIYGMLVQILKSDPNYNTLQQFGTCGQSNLTTLERDMAPSSTLRALKQYTLINLLHSIAKQYFFQPPKTQIDEHSTVEELLNAITDIISRTQRDHKGLASLVEIRNMLASWSFAEKRTQQLENQAQILKNAPTEEDLSLAQILQLHINKQINDFQKTSIGIKVKIGRAIKAYVSESNDAKIFYIHAKKKLERIQAKLKIPPKTKPLLKANNVYKMLEESVRYLVNEPINEERIRILKQHELVDLHKKELTSLEIRWRNIFQHFKNRNIFDLVTNLAHKTLTINKSIFEKRVADVGKYMKRMRKDFLRFEIMINSESTLCALSKRHNLKEVFIRTLCMPTNEGKYQTFILLLRYALINKNNKLVESILKMLPYGNLTTAITQRLPQYKYEIDVIYGKSQTK